MSNTYIRMSTGCPFDARVMAAGNAAFGAFVRMSCWSGEHLTDGVVPLHVARAMATEEEIEALESAGLVVLGGDNLTIPAFLKWNRSKAEVEEAKEKARRRKSKSRAKSPESGNVTRDCPVTDGGVTPPDPNTDPDPDPSLREGVAHAREAPPPPEPDPEIDPRARAIADELERHPGVVDALGGEVVYAAEAALAALAKVDPRATPADFGAAARKGLAELERHPTAREVRRKLRVFVERTEPGEATRSGRAPSPRRGRLAPQNSGAYVPGSAAAEVF